MNFGKKKPLPPSERDIEVKRNDYITIRKGARILSFTPEQAREVRDSLTRALQ